MLEIKLEQALVSILKSSSTLADQSIYPGHTDEKKDESTHIIVTATGLGGPLAYAGYPDLAVQFRVQTQSDDEGMGVHARLVDALRALLGYNNHGENGQSILDALNTTPGLGCSCYTVETPTAEAQDPQRRQHGLVQQYRFWIHHR